VSPTVFATARGKSPALAFEFIMGAAVDCARLSYQKTGTPTAFPRTGELRSSCHRSKPGGNVVSGPSAMSPAQIPMVYPIADGVHATNGVCQLSFSHNK
jgi:hypothetical protein